METVGVVPDSEKRAAKIGDNAQFGYSIHVALDSRWKFCFRYGLSLGGPVGGRWERCYYEFD